MNLMNKKTQILGLLLVIFGVLQTMSPQIKTLVDPSVYGWYTVIVGVSLFALGVLKKGSGNILMSNRTWLTGLVLAVLGGFQQHTKEIEALLSPTAFTLFNIVGGLGIAILGYLNTLNNEPKV